MGSMIPTDANVRVLLVAALQRGGGTLTLTHLELGEAAIASFGSSITVENTDDGAIFRLVQDAPTGATHPGDH